MAGFATGPSGDDARRVGNRVRADGPPADRGPRDQRAGAESVAGASLAAPAWVRTVAAYAWAVVGVALLAVAVVYALAALYVVVVPLIIALFLAALLRPPTAWLRRRGLPSWAATLAVLAVALLALVVLAVFVERRATYEFGAVDFSVRRGLQQVEGLLGGLEIVSPRQITEAVEAAGAQFFSGPRLPGSERPNPLLTGAIAGFTVLAQALLCGFVLFFFLLEGRRLWQAFVGVWPVGRREDVDAVGRAAWAALQAYLRGITLVAMFNSVLLGLALVVIGVPLVPSLMIVMFLATYLPLVGSYLAGAVAALVAFVLVGATEALVVLAAVVVIQLIEGNVFYPLVVGRGVRLHPVVIVIALSAGATLAGVVGALVAVPLAAMVAAAGSYFRSPGDSTADATGGEPGSPRAGHAVTGT